MRINLLTHDNGVGLTQDVRIVREMLSRHHIVQFTDLRQNKMLRCDVNIFFEILDARHYNNARHNLFFPNPEWFWWPKLLNGIDIVLAKTRDAVRIFESITNHPKVEFVSFTSEDRLMKDVNRERAYLHTAGQSETKGTSTVFNGWKPDYPKMVFTKLKSFEQYKVHHDNILTCFERLPIDMIKTIQNKCVFHICPSEYEGFGHYIWEAKSCGGIVLTTDGPPMNEMVTDGVDGFVIRADRKRKMNFARCSLINQESFQEVIERTMNLSDDELIGMQAESRSRWETNNTYFRRRINEIIDSL